jgi:hypothetical protein
MTTVSRQSCAPEIPLARAKDPRTVCGSDPECADGLHIRFQPLGKLRNDLRRPCPAPPQSPSTAPAAPAGTPTAPASAAGRSGPFSPI